MNTLTIVEQLVRNDDVETVLSVSEPGGAERFAETVLATDAAAAAEFGGQVATLAAHLRALARPRLRAARRAAAAPPPATNSATTTLATGSAASSLRISAPAPSGPVKVCAAGADPTGFERALVAQYPRHFAS